MLEINQFQNKKIYFYCHPPLLRREATYATGYHFYQHGIICLAEGLKALGIEYHSNVNYWLTNESPDSFLFRYNPEISPDNCDVVVISGQLMSVRNCLPKRIFDIDNLAQKNRSYLIAFIDPGDSVTFAFDDRDFEKIDFCFKTHRIANAWYPSNFHPWAIGLSERILKQLADLPPFLDRKQQVLCNFRPTLFGHHSLRKYIYDEFLPKIKSHFPVDNTIDSDAQAAKPSASAYDCLMLGQTSGRHVPAYYKRLLSSQAILAFGGYFLPPFPKKRSSLGGRATRKIVEKLHLKTRYIDQWDSWRFYEALAAGCVPIHVDFEKYGFIMPVMPKNWEHYIGIDLDNLEGSIAKIKENLDRLPEISKAGREWVLENYSPVPTALRFLETVFGKN